VESFAVDTSFTHLALTSIIANNSVFGCDFTHVFLAPIYIGFELNS